MRLMQPLLIAYFKCLLKIKWFVTVEHLSNADDLLGDMFLEEKTPNNDEIKVSTCFF